MERTILKHRKSEQGFTLVELAIVLIIVGLLITGVLKGQELITNAEISSTATSVRAVDAAISTFRDSYAAFPGDMLPVTAIARIPTCGTCAGGDGNGRIAQAVGAAGDTGEALVFWEHLIRAEMLVSNNEVNPVLNPKTPIAGFFSVGYHPGPALAVGGGAVGQGHFIVIANTDVGTGDTLAASEAARLDRKTDDGLPATGTTQSDGGCLNGAVYDEAVDDGLCRMALGLGN